MISLTEMFCFHKLSFNNVYFTSGFISWFLRMTLFPFNKISFLTNVDQTGKKTSKQNGWALGIKCPKSDFYRKEPNWHALMHGYNVKFSKNAQLQYFFFYSNHCACFIQYRTISYSFTKFSIQVKLFLIEKGHT